MQDDELRATIYARVSTGLQAEEGTSIDRQIDAGLRAARELGARVMHIRRDEGVSGALYYSRNAIQDSITDIKSGTSNVLIVFRIDRQGRDYDVINRVEREVERYGGRIWYSGGINYENSAMGRFQKNNEKNMAVFERDIIRERTSNGRRAKAEREGQQPSRAMHPYGYRIVKRADVMVGRFPASQIGQYVVEPTEAPWVEKIFRDYAGGCSLRQLCRDLEEAAVPTPRRGRHWSPATLTSILDNSVYYGKAVFGRHERRVDEERLHQTSRQTHRPKREYYTVTRPESQWIFLDAPALVTRELWDQCQARRAENVQRLGGNPERRFMLSTLLRCPKCGRGMYGANSQRLNKGPSFYRCTDWTPTGDRKRARCNPTRYRAEQVDAAIIDAIIELASRPEEIEQALEAYARHRDSVGTPEVEVTRLEGELEKVKTEQRAAVTAQIHGITAGADPSAYDEVFRTLASRRRTVEERLSALCKVGLTNSPRTSAEQYQVVLDAVREALTAKVLTPAEKHAILSTLITRIVPEDEETFRIYLKSLEDTVNNIELIQWFRRWDDWSEEELGVPDNEDRSMLIDEWREERRRQELPSA